MEEQNADGTDGGGNSPKSGEVVRESELSKAEQFSFKLFDVLHAEIDANIKEIRAFERYAIIVTGAIWAWLATHSNTSVLAWSLPALLGLAGAFRNRALYLHLGVIGSYLKCMEDIHLQGSGIPGWERWLDADRNLRRRINDNFVWILIVLIAIFALVKRDAMVTKAHEDLTPVTVQVQSVNCPTAPVSERTPFRTGLQKSQDKFRRLPQLFGACAGRFRPCSC